MRNYNTFEETEELLQTAIRLPGSSIKDIGAATNIKVSTLYKWNTGNAHLSPNKADKLLLYFMENEPERLELAELVQVTSMYIVNNLFSSSFLKDVPKQEDNYGRL